MKQDFLALVILTMTATSVAIHVLDSANTLYGLMCFALLRQMFVGIS